MEQRGLRAYIQQKAATMRTAVATRPRAEDWREKVEATVVADDATGVRKMRIRDWEIIGDSGPAFGGWNLGPSSPELFCGIIGTCLTHMYLIGAAAREIPLDRVSVHVTADNNDAALLGLSTSDPALPFNITANVDVLASDADAEALASLHRYVAENCPLTNLVRTPNPVTIRLSS